MIRWLQADTETERDRTIKDQLALIETLKTQVAECQLKYEEMRRQNYGLKKRLTELGG